MEPEIIEKLDPSQASEDLDGAPDMVRRADVWLQDHSKRAGRTATAVFVGLSPFIGLILGALPVASLTGSEPLGLATAAAIWAVGAGVGVWSWRSWGKTHQWANATVGRYRQLQSDIGLLGHRSPIHGESSGSVDRMVDRILELAGPDRTEVSEAARGAREHIRQLEQELEHLKAAATGNPEADAVLDSARERITTTIAQTQARVAEVYAGLVEEQASQGDDATGRVQDSLSRLQADLEVEQKLKLARAQRASAASRQ